MIENNLYKKCIKDIAKAKMNLIFKAKSKGLYENFGDREIRKIESKYDCIENHRIINDFRQWCYNYEG